MDIEQQALDLWQKQYDDVGARELGPKAPNRRRDAHFDIVLATVVVALSRVPEGYALVPIDPTPAMVRDGAFAGLLSRDEAKRTWAALRAARPKGRS